MSKPPISYRIGRGTILTAGFVAAYLLWTFFVSDWLQLADSWIADVTSWANDLNPLWSH